MLKFLLFIAVIVAVVLGFRSAALRASKPPARGDEGPAPEAKEAESMTRCARCGLVFPAAEALQREGQDFCNEEHRQLGVGR